MTVWSTGLKNHSHNCAEDVTDKNHTSHVSNEMSLLNPAYLVMRRKISLYSTAVLDHTSYTLTGHRRKSLKDFLRK